MEAFIPAMFSFSNRIWECGLENEYETLTFSTTVILRQQTVGSKQQAATTNCEIRNTSQEHLVDNEFSIDVDEKRDCV